MAVTVTKAAPATSIVASVYGSRGPAGSDVYVNAEGLGEQKRVRLSQLTLSGTYATGGFTLTPSDYGLTVIDALLVVASGSAVSGGAAVPALTTAGASPVVKLFTDNAATELANATSVTNHRYTVVLIGS